MASLGEVKRGCNRALEDEAMVSLRLATGGYWLGRLWLSQAASHRSNVGIAARLGLDFKTRPRLVTERISVIIGPCQLNRFLGKRPLLPGLEAGWDGPQRWP